jgi:hypothetical protein
LHSASLVSHESECDRIKQLTNFISDTIPFHRRERAPGSDQRLALRPFVDVLRVGFVEPCRVAEGENYGVIDVLGHFLDDILSKCFGFSRSPNENIGLDLANDIEQRAMRFTLPL